jgi:CubicO group peptidase (beta-lactamase class C family)
VGAADGRAPGQWTTGKPTVPDRRRFILGGAGLLLATMRPRPLWPLQADSAVALSEPAGPDWLPDGHVLDSLPRLLELAEVPGLALGGVHEGKVWSRGFGRASLAPPTRVSSDTVFEAVSLGKPLAAYAALQLVDAGLLELDRPVYEYVPSPEADNRLMRRVTTRHILSHTTGLPNWREQPGALLPASEPGSRFTYSGEGYFYLQRVMERVTGTPFARLMRDRVLEPLGMRNSSYVWLPRFEGRKAAGRDAEGHEVDVYGALGRQAYEVGQRWGKPVEQWRYDDEARAVPLINPEWPVLPLYMIPSAAGSLLTTVEDYVRFLVRLVAQPPAPGLALSPELLRQIAKPLVSLNRVLGWGLGWGVQRDEHGELLWHWGANNSFRNFVLADRNRGRALVAFTNGESGPKVYERVIAALTGYDQAAFLWL